MDKKKLLTIGFYLPDFRLYREYIPYDEYALSTFRGGSGKLSRREKREIGFKAVQVLRLSQSNQNTIWKYFFSFLRRRYHEKYGIEIFTNMNIGKGLVIGHWGRIIIHGDAKIGDQCMITHNVTIGRDIRGKRQGVPTIGNRVAIRTNSTVVGKITIGDDVVIAPNTFVNFDVPSNSIVIGNPARIIPRENASEGHVGKLFAPEQ